jgi:ABC-type oligopeptide transport system substrate-binding subunit
MKNDALRQAISSAIDREKILTDCFRERQPQFHRALTGPYPPGSWACDSKFKVEGMFNLDHAKTKAQVARNDRSTRVKITLKYPDNDPAVARACKVIREQLKALDINLELIALEPRKLHDDVEVKQDYDLAYYHWDYSSQAYSLSPLFDRNSAGPGGRNYMDYKDENAILDGYLQDMMTHRDFRTLQRLAHDVHARINDRLPFIPLWQLDMHIAIHESLTMPAVPDPLRVFGDVEQWSLEKR